MAHASLATHHTGLSLRQLTTATARHYRFSQILDQWRRQDLLRGGAKLEILSWGIHGVL